MSAPYAVLAHPERFLGAPNMIQAFGPLDREEVDAVVQRHRDAAKKHGLDDEEIVVVELRGWVEEDAFPDV